jgi:RNA polymerase sigma-70 factor (ECF subfamily)
MFPASAGEVGSTNEHAPGLARPLESFRPYLRMLADLHLPRQQHGRLDPSDVVQETLLKAKERLGQFRGTSAAELAAWLRRMLRNAMIDALRRLTREPAVLSALEQSSARLEASLAGDGSSPSEQAVRHEELEQLAAALAQLPEDQRLAVQLQQMHGHSVQAIAALMGRSKSAVGGLLRRGMAGLRQRMQP